MSLESHVKSPCVRQCCLDENDICLGCFRSLEEILAWTSQDDEQKRMILQITEQRRKEDVRRVLLNSQHPRWD